MRRPPHRSCRGRRTGRRLAVAATLGIVAASVPTAHAMADARPQEPGANSRLTVVDQQFAITPEGTVRIAVELPSSIDSTTIDTTWSIEATSHTVITSRAQLWKAFDGELPPEVDRLSLPIEPGVAGPTVDASTPGRLTITVATSATDSDTTLRLSTPGVHALELALVDSTRSVAQAVTYIAVIPPDISPADELQVGVVMRQTSTPTIGTDGTVSLSSLARAEFAALTDSVAALRDTAATTGVDATAAVLVDPASLDAVVQSQPDGGAALLTALGSADLLASPALPLDPSSAARAGRSEAYTDALRDGEDLFGALLPATVVDRAVDLVDAPISTAGALLQRTLGTRLMVLPFEQYEALDNSLGGFTDTTQLVGIDLGDGSTVNAAVVDPTLAARLASTADPHGTAVEVGAELLVIGGEIARSGRITARHGMVLGLPDLGVIDAAVLTRLAPILATTPGLRWSNLGSMSATVDRLLLDGRPVVVGLPSEAGPDLEERFALADIVADETVEAASMLPGDDPRVPQWVDVVRALPTTAIDDDQALDMVDRLRVDFDEVKACVVLPDPYSFTLTGRSSELPLVLTNRCTHPVSVRVQLDSAKIDFPDGEPTVLLQPSGSTTVGFQAEARSNGQSSVFLRVFPPAPDSSLVAPEVVLTARVNSLAGVGQLLMGAGLLVVLAWWFRHWRDSRRRALTDEVAGRHPAAGGSPPVT